MTKRVIIYIVFFVGISVNQSKAGIINQDSLTIVAINSNYYKNVFSLDDNQFEVGQVYCVNPHIVFKYNRPEILTTSFPVLNSIATFLKEHPLLQVEIGQHKDGRGGDKYSTRITYQRAKSIEKQLLLLGVDSNQLRWKGYEESKPVIQWETIMSMKSKHFQEKAHQVNRRTEFTILRTDYAEEQLHPDMEQLKLKHKALKKELKTKQMLLESIQTRKGLDRAIVDILGLDSLEKRKIEKANPLINKVRVSGHVTCDNTDIPVSIGTISYKNIKGVKELVEVDSLGYYEIYCDTVMAVLVVSSDETYIDDYGTERRKYFQSDKVVLDFTSTSADTTVNFYLERVVIRGDDLNIPFEFNSDSVGDLSYRVEFVQLNTLNLIELTGHITSLENDELRMARVNNVKSKLVSQGLNPRQILINIERPNSVIVYPTLDCQGNNLKEKPSSQKNARVEMICLSVGGTDCLLTLEDSVFEKDCEIHLPSRGWVCEYGRGIIVDRSIEDSLGVFLTVHDSLSVEIYFRTDFRGGNEYNIKLSRQKAEALHRYLIEKFDIDSTRIKVYGVGEEAPTISRSQFLRKDISKTTIEKYHRINRRTIVKIVGTKFN